MVKPKKDKDDKPVKVMGDGDNKAVDLAIKELQQKYGEGAIMKLGEARKVDVDVIPTGSISLDLALGVGGVPRGRVVEVYGLESSGKTTLALHLVAEMQKKGGTCAYVDAEHALDPEYAKRIGVKTNDLLISQPDTGEQALEIVETLVRSGGISLVVVDSVAALTPRAEIEGEMDQQHMGLQARLMSHALRKLTGIISKTNTTVLFINQIRHKIGVMFGCLNYKSTVNLVGGRNEWIGRLVNQKKEAIIYSYNWKKGIIEPRPVTGWFNNGPAKKFLQITVYKPAGNGRAQIACTPNHPILTPVGWRRADQLKVDDLVMSGIPIRLNDLQMEIIRGSLLGDGALSHTIHKGSRGIRFRLGHSAKQEAYLRWKAGFFSNIKSTITINKKGNVFFDSTPLPELYELREEMYKNGQKVLAPDFITKLSPLSLAIWYMDDGHLDTRDAQMTKGRIAMVVQAMAPESRLALQHLLASKYGIQARLGKVGGKAILTFTQDNADKFQQLIRRYIHPSMKYKLLPRHHGFFSVATRFSNPVWKPLAVPVLDIHEKPATRSMMRFDIGVRGTHNFLADGIIVHNSPETTTGGLALKFYASVRVEMRRSAKIQAGEKIIGNRVTVKIVKNKVAPPFRTAEFDIMYNEGISRVGDLVNTGVALEVVSKSGSWYNYGDVKLGQGTEGAKQFLKENPKIEGEILKKIREAAAQREI